jgi:hypothetical protein
MGFHNCKTRSSNDMHHWTQNWYVSNRQTLETSTLSFLPEDQLVDIPEPMIEDFYRFSRWKILTRLQQHFWLRSQWKYLHQLQQRHKWKRGTPNLKIGKLVTIKDEQLPPSKWLVGRVMELHPGKDDLLHIALKLH